MKAPQFFILLYHIEIIVGMLMGLHDFELIFTSAIMAGAMTGFAEWLKEE